MAEVPVPTEAPPNVYDVACRAWERQPAGSPKRLIAAINSAYEAGVAAAQDLRERAAKLRESATNPSTGWAIEAILLELADAIGGSDG